MKMKKGLTFMETLIICSVLVIVAAIVVPQYSRASGEAKESTLLSKLQAVRSQIELYKIQHRNSLPCGKKISFNDAMTKYTAIDGSLAMTQAAVEGSLGPYLERMPVNPFNGMDTVREAEKDDGMAGDAGWFISTSTGQFRADDTSVCGDGTPHSKL